MKRAEGFSLVELLVALAVTGLVLGATLGSFNDALGLQEKAALMADLEQNLRSGMSLMIRDFVQAASGIPTGGIPIPSGAGALPINRPGPPGTSYRFSDTTLAAGNPGAGLGPVVNGPATDIVNLIYADNTLPLNQTPLAAIASNGSSMTVSSGTPIGGANGIRTGDLIMFSNALGNALQHVTGVSGQTVNFATGDSLNLNQPGAAQGSIMNLRSGTTFPPTTATRVWMVTYYLDTTADPQNPRLMRRINNRTGETVALVLEDLQLSYDLVDGVTNPTGIDTPTAPNSPNQIRKVNIFLTGRSSYGLRNNNAYLRKSLRTQVSLRSLSFVNRYL